MDAFGLELELERLEALIAQQVGEAALGLWNGGVHAPPPVLVADATRRVLAEARVLPGDLGARARRLWRMAIGAQWPTWTGERTETAMIAMRAECDAVAQRLGFADAWTMARAINGEDDQPVELDVSAPAAREEHDEPPGFERVLEDPRPLLTALEIDPAIIRVEIVPGELAHVGRTYVIAPRRDVRVRVGRGRTARGTVRVLLHELGHARLAASWPDLPWAMCAPPSRAFDEATAAWTASLLEDDDFLRAHGLPAVGALERAARSRRRARLVAAAEAEHAFYTANGPAPWQDPRVWDDPCASYSYAAAETLRDWFNPRVRLD